MTEILRLHAGPETLEKDVPGSALFRPFSLLSSLWCPED